MKFKKIKKNHAKFKTLLTHIKNRCDEENTLFTQDIIIEFDEIGSLSHFQTILPRYQQQSIIKRFDLFSSKNRCSQCFNYQGIERVKIEDVHNELSYTDYKDCRYCLKNLNSFLRNNNIKKFRIISESFNRFLPDSRKIPVQLLFKKAFEHYASGKSLINNPLTIEQGVINFSECLEKILKGLAIIYSVDVPKTHNISEIYRILRMEFPNTPVLNQKLLEDLSLAYSLLRYKEQKIKINTHMIINATNIETEIDYIIDALSPTYLNKESLHNGFLIKDIWTKATELNPFLQEEDYMNKRKVKEFKFSYTGWVRENYYFFDINENREYHIEKNYQARPVSSNWFFVLRKNVSCNYNLAIMTKEYNMDNLISEIIFINNDLYKQKM